MFYLFFKAKRFIFAKKRGVIFKNLTFLSIIVYYKDMKCLFVYNPKSGKGKFKKKEEYIVKKLSQKFSTVDVIQTERAGHAKEIAEKACGKYDVLVCAGGDGTLSEVVGGVAEKEKAPLLGYIPAGTVNDVARSLSIPKKLDKALDHIINGKPFTHDIFKAGKCYGIYVCCAGLFTETSYATGQSNKRRLGKIAYVLHGARKMFTTKAMPIKLCYEGGEIEEKSAFLLISNSRYTASFPINRRADLKDGLVDVVLIKERKEKVSLSGIGKVLSLFLFGLAKRSKKGVTRLQLSSFDIQTSENSAINIDGEYAFNGSFHFEVIKGGVKILL